tara:strand:- start:405 stop:698 length:294 start_codon:yes stop_codon:yes gene_type:complete
LACVPLTAPLALASFSCKGMLPVWAFIDALELSRTMLRRVDFPICLITSLIDSLEYLKPFTDSESTPSVKGPSKEVIEPLPSWFILASRVPVSTLAS